MPKFARYGRQGQRQRPPAQSHDRTLGFKQCHCDAVRQAANLLNAADQRPDVVLMARVNSVNPERKAAEGWAFQWLNALTFYPRSFRSPRRLQWRARM